MLADDFVEDPTLYPNDYWNYISEKYYTHWRYFSGAVFEETVSSAETGKEPLKYPLKINLVKTMCLMHASTLWGQWEENEKPFFFDTTEKAKRVLDSAFKNARSLAMRQAIAMPVFGGTVWGIKPTIGDIRVWDVAPDFFYPVWDPTDYTHLLEVFIAFMIPAQTARLRYSYSGNSHDKILYVEHWTEQTYEVTVGGEPAKFPGTTISMAGKNPYGIIPYEYIPRIRISGQFYGLSLAEDIEGIQDEFNLRLADIGDAVSAATHSQAWVRNLVRSQKDMAFSPDIIMNLGMEVPGHNPPEMGRLPAPEVPQSTEHFLNFMLDMSRTATFIPPVAFGEDEGSQRSGLTLVIRMWPLVQQIKMARAELMDGLESLARKILKVARVKGIYSGKDVDVKVKLHPIMPRDRQDLVTEVVTLFGSSLISPESALEKLGVSESDVPEELGRIKQYQKWIAELENGKTDNETEKENSEEKVRPSGKEN